MKLSNLGKTKLLLLYIVLFIINVLSFMYIPLDTLWSFVIHFFLVTILICVIYLYIKLVHYDLPKDNKEVNGLFFLGFTLFFTNVLVFDYLSWDIWWVPYLQAIITGLFIWIVVVLVRKLHGHKRINKITDNKDIS